MDGDGDGARKLRIAIDHERGLPYYQQLREQLRAAIVDGSCPPGHAIPSERELMRIAGVSRMTVRQAIAELTHEGLLRRDHGRGTFVVSPRVQQEVKGVYSFSERVRAQGRTPSTRLLARELIPASEEQAAILLVEPGDPLIRMVRQRRVDGEPAMVDIVHIPCHLAPALMDADVTGSLYVVLTRDFDLPPLRSTDTFEAVAADGWLALALDLEPGAPLILMRRLALTRGDMPLELTEEYARPDRCRYRISLVAEPPLIELMPDREVAGERTPR